VKFLPEWSWPVGRGDSGHLRPGKGPRATTVRKRSSIETKSAGCRGSTVPSGSGGRGDVLAGRGDTPSGVRGNVKDRTHGPRRFPLRVSWFGRTHRPGGRRGGGDVRPSGLDLPAFGEPLIFLVWRCSPMLYVCSRVRFEGSTQCAGPVQGPPGGCRCSTWNTGRRCPTPIAGTLHPSLLTARILRQP